MPGLPRMDGNSSSQKNTLKWQTYHNSAVVYGIILPFAYPKFTVHMQNLL